MKLKLHMLVFILFALTSLSAGCTFGDNGDDQSVTLTISAAASMKDALDDVTEKYKSENQDVDFVVNYGSSGSLMNQISEGAKVDIFISAAQMQMDMLESKDLIDKKMRTDILENSLVFVVQKGDTLYSLKDLETGKLESVAIGETNSVPAGQYAKEAFENIGFYDSINSCLVFAKDVRTVLSWVETGNVQGGVVYSSDAHSSDKVDISFEFPQETHSPITYPAAIVKDSSSTEAAKMFLDYLKGEAASDIFKYHGFKPVK